MTKSKSQKKRNGQNGKGDSPRNNISKKFKSNYEKINWKNKKS